MKEPTKRGRRCGLSILTVATAISIAASNQPELVANALVARSRTHGQYSHACLPKTSWHCKGKGGAGDLALRKYTGSNVASGTRQNYNRAQKQPLPSALHSLLNNDGENDPNRKLSLKESVAYGRNLLASFSSLMALWLPLFAVWGIPALVSNARSFPPNSPDQYAAVTLLIVSNRIYLYALAMTIVGVAAVRGTISGDSKALGQRLTALTEELLVLDRPLSLKVGTTSTEKFDDEDEILDQGILTLPPATPEPTPPPSFVRKMVDDSGLEESLDGVDSGTQALLVPLLVSGLLAASVISLPFWSSQDLLLSSSNNMDSELWQQLQTYIRKMFPFFGQLWNAALLTLFTRAELRRLGYELFGIGGMKEINGDSENGGFASVPKLQIGVECLMALAITGYGAYYLQYWPACNFVNMSVAILVARALRLDSLLTVAGALALLTLYDGASVFLIPAAHAASTFVADASAASASAMGSVAVQKLTSAGFQPGLLVTKLDGDKLTGTLGLGDAVFPSILASFLKRFDDDQNERKEAEASASVGPDSSAEQPSRSRLFEASLVGYAAGCLACEFAPTISTGGVPALVFLLPSMGLATFLAASTSGSLGELSIYKGENGRSNSRILLEEPGNE